MTWAVIKALVTSCLPEGYVYNVDGNATGRPQQQPRWHGRLDELLAKDKFISCINVGQIGASVAAELKAMHAAGRVCGSLNLSLILSSKTVVHGTGSVSAWLSETAAMTEVLHMPAMDIFGLGKLLATVWRHVPYARRSVDATAAIEDLIAACCCIRANARPIAGDAAHVLRRVAQGTSTGLAAAAGLVAPMRDAAERAGGSAIQHRDLVPELTTAFCNAHALALVSKAQGGYTLDADATLAQVCSGTVLATPPGRTVNATPASAAPAGHVLLSISSVAASHSANLAGPGFWSRVAKKSVGASSTTSLHSDGSSSGGASASPQGLLAYNVHSSCSPAARILQAF